MTPEPWTCSRCGARVQWRRTEVVCIEHGTLAKLSQPLSPDPKDSDAIA